jgi:ATP-binding cassette subfamily C protein CydC
MSVAVTDEAQGERASTAHHVRALLRLLRPYRGLVLAAMLCGVVHQLTVLLTAATSAWLVGQAVTGASVAEMRGALVVLGVLMVPLALTPWLDSRLAHVAAFRSLVDVRGRLYDAFERLAPGGLIERRSGDLGATAISDVEQFEGFFAHTLSPLVVAATVPIAALTALLSFRWELAVVLAPALVLLATVPFWLRRRAEAEGARIRDTLGELNAEVVDTTQGLRELLTNDAGTRQLARIAGRDRELLGAKVAHARRGGIEQAATDLLAFGGLLSVLVTAAYLVADGRLDRSLLSVAVVLALAAFVPVAAVTDAVRDLHIVLAAAGRIERILTTPAPVDDLVDEPPPGPIATDVRFDGVTFRYPGATTDATTDVSFEIGTDETVALVGHSGAGKSTCAHLLLRLWDVQAGAVLIGGHDVRAFPRARLRELVSHVPQDVHLFDTSLRENIRLARPAASDGEVTEAARAAQVHEFIASLPDGFDTRAGELGSRLSGGQRQRIAIARALLRDAPILVLDEAVSNLDAESEQEVTLALSRLRAGRATLVIAHRLSTIRSADRVVMLDGGRVVASGTHDDLLVGTPAYRDLLAQQLAFATQPAAPSPDLLKGPP